MEFKRNTEQQFNLLKAMGEIVSNMNNEEAYYESGWLYLWPDEADDDELREIAEDAQYFDDVANCFFRICKTYGKDGFCTIMF